MKTIRRKVSPNEPLIRKMVLTLKYKGKSYISNTANIPKIFKMSSYQTANLSTKSSYIS